MGLATTTIHEFVSADDGLPTSECVTDSEILTDIISSRNHYICDDDAEDDEEDDQQPLDLPVSISDAMDSCLK